LALVAHCEKLASCFAVLDIPKNFVKTDEILSHREMFDTQYAALYHPWLSVYDPLEKKNVFIPPSGSVMGIYARSDAKRGVHKAPSNEVVHSCTGLSVSYSKGEQDILNSRGINLIRAIPDLGINVWGARTASSNVLWKYVNVQRLFIYIKESIKANTNWVVFEHNDETLWERVQRTAEVFLTELWRNGALAGTSSSEAFYVQVGRSTMSVDDIDNGRLICVIGIALVKPAEFVTFCLKQKTALNN
jgi:phage tail sheath protein FI